MPKGVPGPIYTNKDQSLNKRLRYLRQHMDPYMTQEQLSVASGISMSFIRGYELGHKSCTNMGIATLNKLANGLDCKLIIRLAKQDGREIVECLPEGPPLPPAPKRSGKISVAARTRALSREPAPWTALARRKRQKPRKSTA